MHAYGFADDALAHLKALTGGDEAAQRAATRYLHSAIMHQGTPWPATGPIAAYVARVVSSGAAPPGVNESLRDFLAEVLDAVDLAHRSGGEQLLRARVAALGADLDAELREIDEEDIESAFMDEDFGDLVMAHAFLGVLAVEGEVRAALRDRA